MRATRLGYRRRAAFFAAAAFIIGVGFAAPAGAQTAGFVMEPGTNRYGGDYASRVAASPAECAALCRAQERCQAFSYVQPNNGQGPQGICWLKSSIPQARPHPCCVSGVKSDEFDLPDGPGVSEEP